MMSKPGLFKRVAQAIGGTAPPADAIRTRIQDAQIAAADAERAWRVAALAVETGGDPTQEKAAEAGLRSVRQELTRLEAILLEVEAQDAEAARAAQKATDDAQDAELAQAFDQLAAVAKRAQPALVAYSTEFSALVAAAEKAQGLARTNPRVRQDITAGSMASFVALELARVGTGRVLPPGADVWAGAARDTRQIIPFVDHFRDISAAIRGSLGQ